MNPAEGVGWLMQMSREMSLQMNTWRLFAVTWNAFGFRFNGNLQTRVQAHSKRVSQFTQDVNRSLVPRASRITATELIQWTKRFEQVQKTYGVLLDQFWEEAERFANEHGDAAGGWEVVGPRD
jgi:hypothetical protein